MFQSIRPASAPGASAAIQSRSSARNCAISGPRSSSMASLLARLWLILEFNSRSDQNPAPVRCQVPARYGPGPLQAGGNHGPFGPRSLRSLIPNEPGACPAAGARSAGDGAPGRSPGGRPGPRSGVLGGLDRWRRGPAGHEPPRVLDHGVDHLARLPPSLGRGHLPAALADQRRQDGGVEPVEGGVREPEQRVVLADPLATAPPLHHLEARRAVPDVKQHRQVPALPAALEEGPCAGREQLERIGHAGLPRPRNRLARGRLLGLLMILPERDEKLALAAEMVIQAADAGPGALDYIGDAGIGETLLGEHLAGGIEQCPLCLRRPGPLPGTGRGLAAGLPCCYWFHRIRLPARPCAPLAACSSRVLSRPPRRPRPLTRPAPLLEANSRRLFQ